MTRVTGTTVALLAALTVAPVLAQQTTGIISGIVTDAQGGAVAGVTVTMTNTSTGLSRSSVTNTQGLYQLGPLPSGTYDLVTAAAGFAPVERHALAVNVGDRALVNLQLSLAPVQTTVTVTATPAPRQTTSSAVEAVVDVGRLDALPLNGRQFASLATTVPGVGLGFHADATKSSDVAPQINGASGRGLNVIVDGGDNTDDTVGGLLQQYPLESIDQFRVVTQRADAQYGRGGAGVLNVVTRSGTNEVRGSAYGFFRTTGLTARTQTETMAGVAKQDYTRGQWGGSLGGPIRRNRAHYFVSVERTQQESHQVVDTLGLFPGEDGIHDVLATQSLLVGKVTTALRDRHYLSARYAWDRNDQPSGAGLRTATSAWSTSTNRFHSVNLSDSWLLGTRAFDEIVVQYATFRNDIPGAIDRPSLMFPNGVTAGANPNAPQSTEQRKWQFRNDTSWTVTGGPGFGHALKAGVNWMHEPRLYISTRSGLSGFYTLAANNVNAPVQQVQVIGGASEANIPLDSYALYVQDDWRVTRRLVLNVGLRWDLVTGMPIDQSRSPNFAVLQAAGAAGRFSGTPLADFGRTPRADRNNLQPRIGFTLDARGDGRDIVRGGWGLYTDFAYTNANALTASIDAAGGAGIVFFAQSPTGLRRADGSLFRATDPLSSIAALNTVDRSLPPLAGQVVSPRLQQPYTRQGSLGLVHALGGSTTLTADVVRVEGRDLNMRLRLNALVNGRRAFADLPIQPNSFAFRTAVNGGSSLYQAAIVGVDHRLTHGVDFTASYTFSSSTSTAGAAADDLDANLIQDVRAPFARVQEAPSTRTDARHRLSASAIVELPGRVSVAPIVLYRSGLPTHTFEGLDTNADGNVNDRTATAYRYTGLTSRGTATFAEASACETVNCSRRAPFSQVNVRASRGFAFKSTRRIEAIVEVFNLFNARNPFIPVTTRRLAANGTPLASFMQPTAYAGDVQQSEQRLAQLAVRFSF